MDGQDEQDARSVIKLPLGSNASHDITYGERPTDPPQVENRG